jgi:5-methylcytosine-specific restriction protein A
MGEADQDARRTFEILCDQARASDLDVFLAVNGDATSSLEGDLGPWQRLELEVRRRLPTGQLAEGRVIEDAVVVATTCLALALCLLPVEELENPEFREVRSLPEGARMHIEVNRYERSPANRAACIAHYGTVCQVCGLSFADAYGELGTGYIEVHHRVRVADIGQRYFVNPVSDLVPVCANCHAMLHRRTPPLGLEELKDLLRRRKEDPT